MPTRQTFYHRGFSLEIRRSPSGSGFSFAIAQDGLPLHTSRPDFGTAGSADRAARQFVDDALGASDYATQALAA
ncbi:MAG TPA: hypothetical protein VF576_08010 [Rubricoccaceae bacterium]